MKRLTICITVILIIGITITADTQRNTFSDNSEVKTLAILVESNSNPQFKGKFDEAVHSLVSLLIRGKNIENLNVIDTDVNIFNQKWDYLSVISIQILDENDIILCSRMYFKTLDISEADRKLIDSQLEPSYATILAVKGGMRSMHYRATSSENVLLKAEEMVDDIEKIMKGLID